METASYQGELKGWTDVMMTCVRRSSMLGCLWWWNMMVGVG